MTPAIWDPAGCPDRTSHAVYARRVARLALVTGASSGIGAAYADRLARDGWDLAVVARRRDRLDDLAERMASQHGAEVQVIEADLSDTAQLGDLCVMAAGLSVELLVNNAGLAQYGPFAEIDPEAAHALVDLNVLAPVLLARAVLPLMIERGAGAIVNVASLLAFSGAWDAPHVPQRAIYASSKSFLVTFTQVLAQELRDSGVRVQVLCPGVVRTEFHSRQGMDLSAVPRMEPDAVVQASLADLERGAIVSIPGAPDESAFEAILAAHAGLAGLTRVVELPARYADSGATSA
jgi:short-subunit dehydrogenase